MTDEHSYSQPDKVRTTDLALDLALDFAKKTLSGTATYTLEWVDPNATQLVLDTRDLTIAKAEGLGADGQWAPLEFKLAGAADKVLGSKLTIETPQRPKQVRITYTTSPNASGLQWLEPSMTAGKKQPFMFSQSQQIHARSWVPLQDTPHRALHLHRARHRAEGRDGADERRQRSEGRARRRLQLQDAAADPVVPARDRGRRPGVPADHRPRRRVGRAVDGEAGRDRVRRHRQDDRHRREAVRPVSLGPLRHPGAAAVVPVRRHGKPAPDLRHADRDRRRQVAGRRWSRTNWRTAGRATW